VKGDPPVLLRTPSRRVLLGGLGLLALVGAGVAGIRYAAFMDEARRRLSGRSAVIASSFGALEYAMAGEGPPLLMIHGTGGGFDQGLLFAGRLVGRGYRVIAPSRFGYLRSDFPDDPSPANQADAFVALLDHLGIEKLPVAGGSAGSLSAAAFALRHPDRCSGLILLVPAMNVMGRDPVVMTPLEKRVVETVLISDFLLWSAMQIAPRRLIGTLLATDPALLGEVSPAERQRAFAVLEALMPIGAKARGVVNDAKLVASPAGMDFSRIAVPTLVLSLEDDRYGTADTARAIAAAMPMARLVIYPRGGHIYLGHDEDVAGEIVGFAAGLG